LFFTKGDYLRVFFLTEIEGSKIFNRQIVITIFKGLFVRRYYNQAFIAVNYQPGGGEPRPENKMLYSLK